MANRTAVRSGQCGLVQQQPQVGSTMQPMTPDMVQLSALTAAASSAASNMAYTIDAVVKEAVRFFAAMPPSAPVRRVAPAGGSREVNEEVFREFEQRIHADACSAAEACAEVHQWAARDRDSITKDAARSMQAAMAADCVGKLAQRTATRVREVAQCCMLILEEAVQADAGPIAREAAKRCAEQALRSVEAASVAEQHSQSLAELLAPVGANPLTYAAWAAAAAAQAPQQWNQALAGGGTLLDEQLGGRAGCPIPTSSPPALRRWWDEVPALPHRRARKVVAATGGVGAPSRSLASIEAGRQLAAKLQSKASVCRAAAVEADGGKSLTEGCQSSCSPPEEEEDSLALSAIVEWRYGLSLALQCDEQNILDDAQVGQLALWRSAAGEGLPPHLLEAMRQKGAEHSDALIAALQSATREVPQEHSSCQAAANFNRGENAQLNALAYVRPFQSTSAQAPAAAWEEAFDKPHWIPSTSSSAQAGFGGRPAWQPAGQPVNPSTSALAVAAAVELLSADGAGNNALSSSIDEDDEASGKDEGLDIDNMTLHTLHELSMKSRSKQHRRAASKGKGITDENLAPVQEIQEQQGGSGANCTEESEDGDVRQFLLEVLGDCIIGSTDAGGKALQVAAAMADQSSVSKSTLSRNRRKKQTRAANAAAAAAASPTAAANCCCPSASAASVQDSPTVASAKVVPASAGSPAAAAASTVVQSQTPSRDREIAFVLTQGSVSISQTSVGEPVHRLIEPPQLLHAAMGDHDELEDAEGEHVDVMSSDSFTGLLQHPGMPMGRLLPPHARMFPGLRQQGLARTFHESMEYIAVQRREAFGVPPGLGGYPSSSSRYPHHRARTFNEGFPPDCTSLPATPIQGTFIRTPTWTSASSGEGGVAFKDDNLLNPLYIQTGAIGDVSLRSSSG